jgi:protein-L-isoaspartate(D-aspartate) O-methyltransferase
LQKKEDTYRHKGLRKQLISELVELGINDNEVLAAIEAVPRHFFLESALEHFAYENRSFPIGEGQTISQPYTVAFQTQLLQVKSMDRILEVGTGSAYQCTILAKMGAMVFTIERQKKLFTYREANYPFKGKYANLKFFYGDGFEGLPTFGPFDKILITAAAPFVPPNLLEQLNTNGIMVIPVDNNKEGTEQDMKRIIKLADGSFKEEIFNQFTFVPMLKGKNK